MNKPQTLKGFRDFLPETMAIRTEVIRRLRAVFEKYGFVELQTPALEYQEVLLGKYGEEAEKLMYLFNDQGGRGVGMRYDLTVPLARVVAEFPNLPKPFKRYQIQPVWRAEKPQKGRYREFYQCDVDTIGSPSPLADAEIIAVINEGLKALGFPSFKIRINSRQVLFTAMEKSGVAQDRWLSVIQSIDKLDKKPRGEIEQELSRKGLSINQINKVFDNIKNATPDPFLLQSIEFAQKLGAKEALVFDPTLARGLDYYTGPIYESVVEEPKIGSITGGGRYDNLLRTLGGPDLPATGTTIGLDRAADVIEELNLWPRISLQTQVLVTIFSPGLVNQSLKTVLLLRSQGINTELFPDENVKLDKQLKYADKGGIPWVVIVGPKEQQAQKVKVRSMETGEEKLLSEQELSQELS